MRSNGTPVALALVTNPNPLISGNGRFVLFATNENVDPDDTNGIRDVYLRDLTTGTTEPVAATTTVSPVAAARRIRGCRHDGRFVVMSCSGTDMLAPGKDTNGVTDVFVIDRLGGVNERVSVATDGAQSGFGSFSNNTGGALSADGRFAVFKSSADEFPARCHGSPHLGPRSCDRHDRARGSRR